MYLDKRLSLDLDKRSTRHWDLRETKFTGFPREHSLIHLLAQQSGNIFIQSEMA